jgi:uncharacterized heparinase superfamily protein
MRDLIRGTRRFIAGLKPVKVPDAPARSFRDLWPGDAARGARLLRGEFEVQGTARRLEPAGEGWEENAGTVTWRVAAHGFAWLRDLRALGTDTARLRARDLTEDWLARGAAEDLAQAPEVAAARISAWLGHWDFLAATAEDNFRRKLLVRLAQDSRGVIGSLPAEAMHRGALVTLKGAIAAAVALEEEAWMNRALRFLPGELERQFHPDGGHVERSPQQLLHALQDLIEIRNLLHGAGINPPPLLATVLERAGQALRLFRHGDGGLAQFNGTREDGAGLVDLVLTQGQARGRAPLLLEESGFHRLQASRTLVIADAGAPPPAPRARDNGTGLPRGADRFAHAGTLSFEMSVGRDRLIVNCGAAPAAEADWRDALRATAAHSTLVLADTNSSELKEEGLGRRPERVEADRQEADGAQWLDATHDGWRKPFGAQHRRRLYLDQHGEDLRGEDMIEMAEAGASVPGFVVRFHLHPAVVTTLQAEEQAVLLRLPSNQVWRLRSKFAKVTVEESLYLGGSEPRQTSQVVLTAEPQTNTIQWAIGRLQAQPGGEAEADGRPAPPA